MAEPRQWGVTAGLDPLVITSPTPRCGTTLVQRLLCSSSRALIYGEKSAQDFELFLNIYAFKSQEYQYWRENHRQELQKVLRGEVNDWILELSPDVDGYLAALQDSLFGGIAYCRDYAVGLGRPVWGFKYPGWAPVTLRLLRACVPGAHFLFILRDLTDCLKSARAQHLVTGEQDTREFCRKWLEGVQYARSMQAEPGTLVLSYEELTARPAEALAQLASFTGLQDIDPSVLDHKINVWMGQGFALQNRDGYVPPAELADSDYAILAETTAALAQAA
jgi:hypothetical protein